MVETMKATIADLMHKIEAQAVAALNLGHRMGGWLFWSGGFLILLVFVAPQQLGVIIQKVPLITIGAWLAFRLFRGAFPYIDVGKMMAEAAPPLVIAAAIIGRSLMVVACVLGMALAL